MKRILSILLVFIMLSLLTGCDDMRNIEASKQENINNYKNTIQKFAGECNYNVVFILDEKLDDKVSLEGEIKLDKKQVWINFIIYEDGAVNIELFLKDKTYLECYLNSVIELSNSLSKRQFSLDEIKELLANDNYTKSNDTDYLYKHKTFGWMMDSTVSYSERKSSANLTICTGIIH